MIENPNSWPTLAFKAPDATKRYVNSDCYFIGICPDYIEVQKFVNGARKAYYIGAESLKPSTEFDIPNKGQVFEYGKVHHVTAGTIETDEGVRIILNVDGKNIFDILDDAEDALRGPGYMGIYPGAGTFTFSHTEK